MTRGRAATPDPFDLGAVSRSDEVFDALSRRNTTDLAGLADDPAVRLLAALTADVDAGAPPIHASARVACATPGSRRRGVVAVATFGAAVIMLASAGAAAAGGNDGGANANGPARHSVSERSNANLQQRTPGRSSVQAPRPLGPEPDRDAPRPVKRLPRIVVPVTAPISAPPDGSEPPGGTDTRPTPTPTQPDPGQSPTPGGGSTSGGTAPRQGAPHSPAPPPEHGPGSGRPDGPGANDPSDGRTGGGRSHSPRQISKSPFPGSDRHCGGSTDHRTGTGGLLHPSNVHPR